MARPTRALIALEAQGRFADYPIEDRLVREAFQGAGELQGERLQAARDLLKDLTTRDNRQHEQFVRQFFTDMGGRYPRSGFDRLGFVFFNTDSPDAIALHDREDDSYAIGLDYGMIGLFAFTFTPLLHSRLRNLENLTWVSALVDIVLLQFHGYREGVQRRSYSRMIEGHYLNEVGSLALQMVVKFVLAHELGHIHLGHFKDQQATRLNALGTGGESEEISTFAHAAEYEADAWAAQVLRQLAGPGAVEVALAHYVPAIYFGIFALAKALYVPRTPLGRHIRDAHPDPWQRAQRLLPTDVPGTGAPDPLASAIGDLLGLIAAEGSNSTFAFAADWLRSRLAGLERGRAHQ